MRYPKSSKGRNTMNNFINTWGLYTWFLEDGYDCFHPEEIGMFEPNNTRVFYCKNVEDKYLILQYGRKDFRVNPENYKLIEKPKFNYCEAVIVKNQELLGEIEEIQWHYKQEYHIYYLIIDGKRKSRRFYEDELVKYFNEEGYLI